MERIVKGIWIPIEIWEADDLSWNEKILLMEIDSFTAQGKDCFISDEYVADLVNTSIRNASRMMTNLIDKGYVMRTRFDGRRRFVASCLGGADTPNLAEQTRQNCRTTNNNILIEEDKSSSVYKSKFDFRAALKEIGVTDEVADAWLMVRKGKKATNSKIAFDKVVREITKSGRSAEECIRIAAENSWQGFEASWLDKPSYRNQGSQQSTFQHNLEMADKIFGTTLTTHKS